MHAGDLSRSHPGRHGHDLDIDESALVAEDAAGTSRRS